MSKTFHALCGLALIAAPVALPPAASAHGVTRPQHGGVVQMNGETLFELVRAPGGVSLYLIDEDEPADASAMTARLSVTTGGTRRDVPMVAAGGNRFFARGLVLAKGASVGVLVIDRASQSRYGTTFVIK